MSVSMEHIKTKLPLYLQLALTAFAFIIMVVLSYIFMSRIAQGHIVQNTENLIALVQNKIDNELQEPKTLLGVFSQTLRGMVLRGSGDKELQNYFNEFSSGLRLSGQHESSIKGFFGYLDTLQEGPAIIENFDWVRPDNLVLSDRPWFNDAIAANGEIAETLVYSDLVYGETAIVYSKCIFDNEGRRLGIVGKMVSIDTIGKIIVETALARGGYGIFLSQDFIILAHPSQDFVGMSAFDPAVPFSVFEEDFRNGLDIYERPLVSFTGLVALAFFRKLPNNWYLGLVTPKGPYYQSITNMAFILSVLGTVLAMALIYVFIRINSAKNKSDEESKQKSVFLANMSHEMRTPLNAVIGLSELMLEHQELKGENSQKLEKIYSAGMTLLGIVNDILDISKIEAGKFELILAEYDIPSLLNDAAAQSSLHIGEKPVRFILNVDKDVPVRLYGDELRVKQILNNLLSNAFKYIKEGTVELKINCVREDNDVWMNIIIKDTGIGIKPENIPKLFEDYSQIDKKANRKILGTGLGLPITKRLVEMMSGSISVESKFGKGSVFSVRIKQRFVSSEVIGPEAAETLKNMSYSDKKRQKESKLTRLNLSYAHVLIVDDVEINLDIAKGLMKSYNMQIDCVLSGQEAIDAIRAEKVKYNAIFMDHMMPGIDGIEAVRIIREEIGSEYAKNIPVIALTANAIVGNEEMFLSKGFQAFISKPIEIAHLDAVIREWVRDKELEKNLVQINIDGETIPENRIIKDRRAVNDRRSGYDRRLLNQGINGIDMEKALARFDGDESSYFKILRSYAKNTKQLLDAMRDVNSGNLSGYAITVHGIKGASLGIGADIAGSKAQALEAAAKGGDFDFVKNNNDDFIAMIEKIVSEIENMLNSIAGENVKPKKDNPDSEALARLLAACKNYDMDGVDTAMAEIDAYEYNTDAQLVEWLRDNVEKMNFKEIEEKLSAMP